MSKWPLVSLGEIFEIARGGSPRPIDNFITEDADGVNWISISDASESTKYINSTKKKIIKDGVTRSRMVYPGDFLLTNSMSFGRPYIMNTSGCIHDGWLVLSKRKNNVDQDYFYHLLGSDTVYQKFKSLAAGAVVKNLNIDLVKSVKVPLPPIEEQKRIATILDKADSLRRKRREALALADDFLRAVFLDMFGDPVSNPKGWPVNELKALGKVSTGRTPPGDKPGMFDGETPFVTPGDLESNAPTKRSLTAAGVAEVCTVRTGATLVCCIGATIGKMGKATKRSAFNQQINAVEWNDSIDDDYGLAALKFFKAEIARQGASTTLPILKKSSFEKIRIPIPPKKMQQDFANRVAAIDRLNISSSTALVELDFLHSALQNEAFA